MITLNPASTCDVCLELYTCRNPLTTPHALPTCGHILCGRCISRLRRSTCPFCRTPFQPGTVVKLHVAPPGPSSPLDGGGGAGGFTTDQEKELDLLRQLALVWDWPRGDERWIQLRKQINEWLSKRTNAADEPVYRMWLALERYHTQKVLNLGRQIHRPRPVVKQHAPQFRRPPEDTTHLRQDRGRDDYEKRQAMFITGSVVRQWLM